MILQTDGLWESVESLFEFTLNHLVSASILCNFYFLEMVLTNDCFREIDKEEFKTVMSLMRSQHRQGVGHRDGLRTGLHMTGSVEDGGLVEYFFGKDGSQKLKHDKFTKFMKDLTEEVTNS